jgi:hypothetical protein
VLSSTSNSNERLPTGPWGRTWLLAVCLAVLGLGLGEGLWRARGFRPILRDDADFWCWARSTVKGHDPDQVVLIGASRILMDIDTETWAECFRGRKPVQLGVTGSDCVPVLYHLSKDRTFCGILVCDVAPGGFFQGIYPRSGIQAEYVKKYATRSALASEEQYLRLLVQQASVLRQPEIDFREFLPLLVWHGRLPRPQLRYNTILPDRSVRGDYTGIDVAPIIERGVRQSQTAGPVAPEQLRKDLSSVEEMVTRIQERGGEVVFVTFPNSGKRRAAEEGLFPRQRCWDILAAHTKAITIHYRDYPDLARYECPDGAHLDYHSAVPFTKALALLIKDKLHARSHPRNTLQVCGSS